MAAVIASGMRAIPSRTICMAASVTAKTEPARAYRSTTGSPR
jgi:hypothetical protein